MRVAASVKRHTRACAVLQAENIDSMVLLLRIDFQCSAGKSKKVRSKRLILALAHDDLGIHALSGLGCSGLIMSFSLCVGFLTLV